MDETEWLACSEPNRMMRDLRPKAHASYDSRSWFPGRRQRDQLPRRWRLFLAAYCRRIYPRLTNEFARRLIEHGEQFIDARPGEHLPDELFKDELRDSARSSEAVGVLRGMTWALASAAGELRRVAGVAVSKATPERSARQAALQAAMVAEARAQCDLLRDLFGNPFRRVLLDRAWLSWDGGIVASLSQAAEQQRGPCGALDPARLAVLADALEDSGCCDEDILSHLRGPGPHVRGCWVIDLLLKRK
jgi:hypothetical protein